MRLNERRSRGFDAGSYTCDASYANLGGAVMNNLQEAGIRSKLRPIERAAFVKGYADKAYKDIIQSGSGAFGNAATRMESYVVKGGAFSYGSYPDIDALYPQQAVELDHGRRAAILQKMQELVREGNVRADLAACVHQWRWAARGRVELRQYPGFRLHRALRGPR